MINRQNSGLAAYQQRQRDEMIKRIDEAICYLRKKELPITKKSLADEMCVHRNTLTIEYIKVYLLKYPEFNPEISKCTSTYKSELNPEINRLKTANSKQIKIIGKLKYENAQLRLKNNELHDNYQKLLGRYQTDVGNKIIQFK